MKFRSSCAHLAIELPLQRCVRDAASTGVCRVHARSAAEGIARKLVQQDQKRQRALGTCCPVIQFAGGSPLVQREKTIAKFRVERGDPS